MPFLACFMAALVYRFVVFVYAVLIQLAALFAVVKAQLWLKGRRDIWTKLHEAFKDNTNNVIWVHCASLGEFEQGRPLIELLKKQLPQHKILLTFFSPSGYEVRKNYDQADWVFYLPLDTPSNAAKFVKITKPQLAIFVKYEFWYYYLKTLNQQQIPTYLISAIFRPKQIFFRSYGGFFRKTLHFFKIIFVQDTNSKILLENIGLTQVVVAGDTRLDRVLEIKNQQQKIPQVEQFCQNTKVVVCGSSWPVDEVIIAEVAQQQQNYKWILAPHQIDEGHLQQMEQKFAFTKTLRYSKQATATELEQARVLIVDNIGMLSSLYAYANIAYIGGGFGAGIHNCLEAVVFEIPVCFGSNYQKFKEAKDLIEIGVAFELKNATDLQHVIHHNSEPIVVERIAQKAADYVSKHRGATDLIIRSLLGK